MAQPQHLYPSSATHNASGNRHAHYDAGHMTASVRQIEDKVPNFGRQRMVHGGYERGAERIGRCRGADSCRNIQWRRIDDSRDRRRRCESPHLPKDEANTGPLVSFARSGIAAHWKGSAYRSILERAEACDVPVRWACRAGVCHSCESGLVSGDVAYAPEPLDKPAEGNLLGCCSQPLHDVVIDL